MQYLQEHMAAGRLDQHEFDERMTRALGARVESDLVPLFSDLPAPRIDAQQTSTELVRRGTAPVRRGPSRQAVVAARLVAGLSWPAAIIAASVLGWGSFWWFVFIPIFVTPWLLGIFGLDEDGEKKEQDAEDD